MKLLPSSYVYLTYLNAPKAGNAMTSTGCLISSSFIPHSLLISPLTIEAISIPHITDSSLQSTSKMIMSLAVCSVEKIQWF